MLVVDDTGFVKKGQQSVGVARQYSDTAGRIENCQIGVFLAYASRYGQALIDRRLYLPKNWAEDQAMRAKTQVPEAVSFATKPQIACELIAAALDTGMPCAWVLADALGPEEWTTHTAGEGSKGLRLYDWARFPLPWAHAAGFERWVLIRRNRYAPDQRAYYFAFAPKGATLAELAGVAGLRWTIEECFQRAKDDLGLDHCEARTWHGWHRHMSLCMAAAAFLAKLAADLRRSTWEKPNKTSPTSPIAA